SIGTESSVDETNRTAISVTGAIVSEVPVPCAAVVRSPYKMPQTRRIAIRIVLIPVILLRLIFISHDGVYSYRWHTPPFTKEFPLKPFLVAVLSSLGVTFAIASLIAHSGQAAPPTSTGELTSRTFELSYQVHFPASPGSSGPVNLWIPLPTRKDPHQVTATN